MRDSRQKTLAGSLGGDTENRDPAPRERLGTLPGLVSEYAIKAAYACLGMAVYGPRSWALVGLALCAVAFVVRRGTPAANVNNSAETSERA